MAVENKSGEWISGKTLGPTKPEWATLTTDQQKQFTAEQVGLHLLGLKEAGTINPTQQVELNGILAKYPHIASS